MHFSEEPYTVVIFIVIPRRGIESEFVQAHGHWLVDSGFQTQSQFQNLFSSLPPLAPTAGEPKEMIHMMCFIQGLLLRPQKIEFSLDNDIINDRKHSNTNNE